MSVCSVPKLINPLITEWILIKHLHSNQNVDNEGLMFVIHPIQDGHQSKTVLANPKFSSKILSEELRRTSNIYWSMVTPQDLW